MSQRAEDVQERAIAAFVEALEEADFEEAERACRCFFALAILRETPDAS